MLRGLPEGHGSRLDEERGKGLAATVKDSVEGYRAVASDKMLRTFGVGVFFWYFLMQFANFLYLLGLDQTAAGSGVASERHLLKGSRHSRVLLKVAEV